MKKNNKLILNEIKSHYSFKNDADFARFLGVTPQTLSNWYARNTFDHDLIYTKCVEIDGNWLLTGKGEMLRESALTTSEREAVKGIPLIPVEAMAGYANGDSVQVMGYDIQDNYIITPEFENKGIKYLIRVSGSSMIPKYNNGDLLACRPITDKSFLQWGKVYVLDTDQGALVKRLYPCNPADDNCLECRSDNSEKYPPFKIGKASIHRIAIVVGVLRLE